MVVRGYQRASSANLIEAWGISSHGHEGYLCFLLINGRVLFVLQQYEYTDARDRLFLKSFHRIARSRRFDVARYNELKEAVSRIEHDLKRLRDPLFLHLPLHRLQSLQSAKTTTQL